MRIVIIGGGFAGLAAAQKLCRYADCEITLIDRRNFHLFQPLLYQVAMAGLNPSDIAIPLRTLFRDQDSIDILLAEVDTIDLAKQCIRFDDRELYYDYLIVAAGAKHSYFGHAEWESFAPGLKNLEQAIEIRRRLLLAFEQAEKEDDPEQRRKLLTFVVVGGGPTGVELAGAISEMISHTLAKDYRKATKEYCSVVLVEAGQRLLPTFPEALSRKTAEALMAMGVRVITDKFAKNLSADGLQVSEEYIRASTIVWAAGVTPSSLSKQLPDPKDSLGRAIVEPSLNLAGHPNVFVIGDLACCRTEDGDSLPAVAPVAIQQGKHVARVIRSDMKRVDRPAFHYQDRGMMATIGRSQAVAVVKGFEFSGFLAWLVWVFVHIAFISRFKNKFFVFCQWVWSYFTFGRGARLITHHTWKFYSGEKIPIRENKL